VVFDLSGNGRSVIKANYGLYWHNPGVGAASSANPNQAEKTESYQWNDRNGDRQFQLGEQGNRTATALSGAVSIDPDIKQPYTHEAGVFFEHQFAEALGSRIGFVYKTEDDLFGQIAPNRSAINGAYSVGFPFTDIGRDGVRGSADDRVLTLLGMPRSEADAFPVNQVVMNIPGRIARYKTFEAAVSKRYGNRWSAQVGGAYTWLHDFPATVANSFPVTPNHPGVQDRTTWNMKVTASYDAAFGIRISPVLRHQSGANFARTISVPATAGNAFGLIVPSTTFYADEADANREANVWVFDVRAEKTIALGGRMRIRAFLDLFNLTNSSAPETITRSTGANFLRPANILAPFTTRVGFRFLW
jgi:hypothetical protein